MICHMCGKTDADETEEQRAARLKACRRCRSVEEGLYPRMPSELGVETSKEGG